MSGRVERKLLCSQTVSLKSQHCTGLNQSRETAVAMVASVGLAATGAQHETSRLGRESHVLNQLGEQAISWSLVKRQ